MVKTERISVRASVATKEKLKRLAERYGSQSEALAVSVDRLFVFEFGEDGKQMKGGESAD